MTQTRTIVVIAIMLVTAMLTGFVSHSERVKPNKPFDQFPLEFDKWKGNTSRMDDEILNILGVEDYIIANYHKSAAEAVNLYIGFYQSQKEGDIIHSPKNCMPGAGWKIIRTSLEEVQLTAYGEQIKVIKLLLQKGQQKQVVLYWFQSRGRIISSEYWQKIWLVVDSVTKNRTDGSFVRLISPVHKNEQATVDLLKEFLNKIYPALQEHIPS